MTQLTPCVCDIVIEPRTLLRKKKKKEKLGATFCYFHFHFLFLYTSVQRLYRISAVMKGYLFTTSFVRSRPLQEGEYMAPIVILLLLLFHFPNPGNIRSSGCLLLAFVTEAIFNFVWRLNPLKGKMLASEWKDIRCYGLYVWNRCAVQDWFYSFGINTQWRDRKR